MQIQLDLDLPCGKTSLGFSATSQTPSDASCQHSLERIIYLCPVEKDGVTRVLCLDTADKSLGEFLTRSILGWRSEGAEYGFARVTLSEVLETGPVPERYFLSQAACAGILRRAERRGKKLPAHLEAALLSGTADK